MPNARIRMGKKTPKSIDIPTFETLMECAKGEYIFYFGVHTYNDAKYRLFLGVGTVCRIAKGDTCDILMVNFGIHSKHPQKYVYVKTNHARRQILTIKRGWVATIQGVIIYKKKQFVDKQGQPFEKLVEIMYARGIQGWYVPTLLDIKKMPTNEDMVQFSTYESMVANDNKDILDMFDNSDAFKEED